MIDTHSHIYEPEFAEDVHDVVKRARQAGVRRVLLPNINEASIEPMLALCAQYPDYLSPMMGLHPEDVREDYAEVLDRMEQRLLVPHHPYTAVGEVGLDFYWDSTYATQQRAAFQRQIEWAERYHLPLIIHTRSAHRELVEMMRGHEGLRGIFHCFGGTAEEAAELLTFPHFMLGIGGVLTFKKSTLPQVLREVVSIERIVLETDAPYLAPVPYRGKRNEPSFLPAVVSRLAEVYELSHEAVVRHTSANAQRVFCNSLS